MKKIQSLISELTVTLVIVLALTGCKKDIPGIGPDIEDDPNNTGNSNAPGNYYVRFKIDGTTIQYTKAAEGILNVIDSDGHYDCNIIGLKNEFVSDHGTLGILFSCDDAISTGNIYINYGISSPGYIRTRLEYIAHFDDAGTFFASWGDEFSSLGVISDSKVNFTEINPTYIKGNFSATIYKEIDGNSEKHLITDGEFRVKRVR